MKKLIKLFVLILMMNCVYGGDIKIDIEEIEKHIRWLVPDDGKVNGLAHHYLVKSGNPAGELIIKHVFNQPMEFFKPLEKDANKWLYGTQVNATSVLAEMTYEEALPTLKEHYNRDIPEYLKKALKESIERLENASKE